MNPDQEIFDYLVSGGGFIGLTLLSVLANQSAQIGLIESQNLFFTPTPQSIEPNRLDARTTALSAQTAQFLCDIGVTLAEMTAMTRIHISEQGCLGNSTLGEGDVALGFTIANKHLGSALWQRAQQNPNLSLFFSEQIETVQHYPDYLGVTLTSGKTLYTKLLLIAEGNESQTRQKLGFTVETRDYHSAAIVTNIEVSHPKAGMAFERFTQNGPMAMLPLGGANYALIQTLPTALAESIQYLNDHDFRTQAADAFGPKLGVWRANGKRQLWRLTQQLSPYLVRDHAVLMGNAAHTLHPVAGQGFNLGVRDVMSFKKLFIDTPNEASNNQWELLQTYQSIRQPDHQKTAKFTDNLISTFGLKNSVFKHSRSLGLIGLELLPNMKKITIQQGGQGK